MEGQIFVNAAIDFAIRDFEKCKDGQNNADFDSFYVVVIRALVDIYGELDILNPFKTNNEKNFDANLMKFGLKEETLKEFKEVFLQFYQNQGDLDICRQAFLKIQKILIDMFVLRKTHVLVSDEELAKFKGLLYTKEDTNTSKFALYTKYTPDSDEVMHYFNNQLFRISHKYGFTEYKEAFLNADAYQLAGFNANEVMRMKESEIENINNKVYHFFRIKDNDLNKRSRLENAIAYYKKFGNTITSGNGYVDLLLVLGIVATGLMMMVIFGVSMR